MVLAESSPVNVAAQATLDLSTAQLTVVVEAYYTGNGTGATNYLNVAVLQDGIVGPQSGSGANPSQVNPDGTITTMPDKYLEFLYFVKVFTISPNKYRLF